MLVPVTPKYRRRRRRGKVEAARLAALTLVTVEALSVIGPDLEMNLVFNTGGAGTDVLDDVIGADPTKWTARYQGQKYVGSILQNVAPDTLYLQMTPAGAEAGADVLAYSNAPSDVSDSLGRFLAAFSDFPLA